MFEPVSSVTEGSTSPYSEMVWTKEEVDKYVVQVERNCPSPREVQLIHLVAKISHLFVVRKM